MYSGKKAQHDFPKMRGGGDQRPFGTFPKIHPFWNSRPSLTNATCDRRGEEEERWAVAQAGGGVTKRFTEFFAQILF